MLKGQFSLPIYIDLCATFLFGLTGALAALKRGYDVIGLFALAFATAAGGGLIRDGLFIQQGPPAVTSFSGYILVIVLAGMVVLLFREHVIRYNQVIVWLDALGLGAYAVVGVQKSLYAGLSVAAAILVGVINAAGGGLLRDVLVREEPLLFKPGQFYALAAFSGCLLFVLLALEFNLDATTAALISVGATFLFRLLAIHFNWKTVPVWQENLTISINQPATPPAPAKTTVVSIQQSSVQSPPPDSVTNFIPPASAPDSAAPPAAANGR